MSFERDKLEPIDLATEIKAMADFVTARWDHVEHVETLFHDIAKEAQKATANGLAEHSLTFYFYDRMDERRALLDKFDESGGLLCYYDQACCMLDNMRRELSDYETAERDARYDAFTPAAKRLKALVLSEYAHMKEAQPTGLRTMLKHMAEDNEIWEQALSDEYTDSHSFQSANKRSGVDFARNISLICVVQTVDHHNEAPIKLLVNYAYNHLMNVFLINNSCAVLQDLALLELVCKEERPVFELNFEPAHHITKMLVKLAKDKGYQLGKGSPEQGYREAVEQKKTQKPLTEEEIKANKAAGLKMVINAFKSFDDPEEQKRVGEERARTNAEIQQMIRESGQQ